MQTINAYFWIEMESIPSKRRYTLRKPNECPLKIDGLEDVYISYLKQSFFRGYMLVFWGVIFFTPFFLGGGSIFPT